MSHFGKYRRKPVGASPGTVMYVGEDRSDPIVITHIKYDSQGVTGPTPVASSEVKPASGESGISWYTIDGVHDTEVLRVIGENFQLHPLVVEDIANTGQRPKIEDFDNYIFIAMKMITFDSQAKELVAEHVSIILGQGFVLAFLEDEGDVFEPIRARIKAGKGKIRKLGADYLAYALMDAVIDNYFEVLEQIGEEIEEVEDEVVHTPSTKTLHTVHRLKRELIFLRRAVWPMRETANSLLRDESDLVSNETRLYLRDLYDHTVHVMDTVETLRDIVAGMLDVYLSSVSNKLNEVMKVLR
ncbi:MAG: magnesium transport protein CorA, partial [Pseudomonadota bacterium]